MTDVRKADREKDGRPMAHRYLGKEFGDAYVEGNAADGSNVYVIQPETWLTLDYGKLGASSTLIWYPNVLPVPVPVRSSLWTPLSRICRKRSR